MYHRPGEQLAQGLIESDVADMSRQVNLACNENVLSFAGEAALFSPYYSRYFLGDCATRGTGAAAAINGLVLGNLRGLNHLELRGHQAARQLFDATHVETRFLSGVHATLNTILAMTRPGDLVVSLDPFCGGHFATKNLAEEVGRRHDFLPWDAMTHNIDLAAAETLCRANAPKLIFIDCGAPLFPLRIAELREIVGPQTSIVYDGSHALGLIAGGRFQKPLAEGADVLQGNTHKSFPGPQKAIAVTNDAEIAKSLSGMLSRATVSGQDTAAVAALHVTLLEMEVCASQYADALIANAQLFGNELLRHGLRLFNVGGDFSNSHILLVVFDSDDTASRAAKRLISCGIVCNARNLYGKPCLRLGLQEMTRRGIERDDIRSLARLVSSIIENRNLENVGKEITALAGRIEGRKYGDIPPILVQEMAA